MSISVECHNFIGVTIPKCLLCDVPKSCKLHRLSKFHSLTKNHRYPQVMIHDDPPLATLLESLPVVKLCDLHSPSHEAQKYSDALKSYSRALENLKPFAGDDTWHRIFFNCCKTHLKNKSNKSWRHPRNPPFALSRISFVLHQRSTFKRLILAKSDPKGAMSWQVPDFLTTKNAGSNV